MHDCDFMLNIGARSDDRVTGRITGFFQNLKKSTSILILIGE